MTIEKNVENHFQVTNTFQCVVAADGVRTFVFYLYDKLQWTSHNPFSGQAQPARVSEYMYLLSLG